MFRERLAKFGHLPLPPRDLTILLDVTDGIQRTLYLRAMFRFAGGSRVKMYLRCIHTASHAAVLLAYRIMFIFPIAPFTGAHIAAFLIYDLGLLIFAMYLALWQARCLDWLRRQAGSTYVAVTDDSDDDNVKWPGLAEPPAMQSSKASRANLHRVTRWLARDVPCLFLTVFHFLLLALSAANAAYITVTGTLLENQIIASVLSNLGAVAINAKDHYMGHGEKDNALKVLTVLLGVPLVTAGYFFIGLTTWKIIWSDGVRDRRAGLGASVVGHSGPDPVDSSADNSAAPANGYILATHREQAVGERRGRSTLVASQSQPEPVVSRSHRFVVPLVLGATILLSASSITPWQIGGFANYAVVALLDLLSLSDHERKSTLRSPSDRAYYKAFVRCDWSFHETKSDRARDPDNHREDHGERSLHFDLRRRDAKIAGAKWLEVANHTVGTNIISAVVGTFLFGPFENLILRENRLGPELFPALYKKVIRCRSNCSTVLWYNFFTVAPMTVSGYFPWYFMSPSHTHYYGNLRQEARECRLPKETGFVYSADRASPMARYTPLASSPMKTGERRTVHISRERAWEKEAAPDDGRAHRRRYDKE